MSSLKRKETPAGSGGAAKAAKAGGNDAGGRPSKRAKADKSDKTGKAGDASKKSTKAAPAAGAAAVPLVSRLKEDEPLFPRGGGSVLTPLEYKQIQVQAKSDALFDQQTKGGADKAEPKRKQKAKRKHDDFAPKDAKAEDSIKIESLNFKRLVKGSLVLGQVSAITPLEVAVALPNNLVGHLPLTGISQTLNERIEAEAAADDSDADDTEQAPDAADRDEVDLKTLFAVGEYVRASVLSTEDDAPDAKNKRRIELSVRPEHANAGLADQDVVRNCTVMAAVASVEDRGYVMDLGLAGSALRGFLAKTELDAAIPEARMQPGAVLLCLVASRAAGSKVAQLTTRKARLGSLQSVPAEAVTISTFLPGTAVEVLLAQVGGRGLAGKVLGHLDATADTIHSGAGASDEDLEDKYKVGSKVKARVLCTFPNAGAPKIGVSLLPHLGALEPQTVRADGGGADGQDQQPAAPRSPLAQRPLSSTVERCVVRRAELSVGLWVDVGVPGVPGFVHISRVKDGKVDALYESSGPYKVGSVHRGRVVGYNAVDGVFLVSFEQRVLDQPFLRIEDVPVGQVVPGTVQKMLVGPTGMTGLIVAIADGITGLVPELHLADVKLQHPEKKFREGMKVKARVLSTDASRHQIRLTLKKTLVNSDLPPVQSFDELAFRMPCLGTIVSIRPTGAFVQFYGDLRGFLPVAEMSEAPIGNPEEHFRLGQVVSVRVLRFHPEHNKLVVTCKDPAAFGADKQLAFQGLAPGQLVAAKVAATNEDGVEVVLDASGLKAVLPVGHLTDRSAGKNASALRRMRVGAALPELVVLDKHDKRRALTVSRKPSLVAASKAGTLLTRVDQARVGDAVAGFVRNITPTAVFVQFAAHLVALLPKQLMPAAAQNAPDFGMFRFQSLTVRLISAENERLVVALRPEGEEEGEKKKEDKADEAAAGKLVNPVDGALATLEDVRVGVVTQARITAVKATQLNVQLADNAQGRIDITEVFDAWEDVPDQKNPLGHFAEGQVVAVRVLGVHDARKRVYLPITQRSSRSVFELSAKPSTVQQQQQQPPLTMEAMAPESTWLGFVNNIKSNCLWVSVSPSVRGRLYGMEASDDLGLVKDLAANFPVGTALRVRVLGVDAARGRLDLSARSADAADGLDWDGLGANMVLAARVTRVSERQVVVQLSKTVSGPVHLIDLADDYERAVTTGYFQNDIVRVAVVAVDGGSKKVRLSMRPSRVLSSALPVEDREIARAADVARGQVLRGFVRSVSDKGLFVNLGGEVVALVHISDLSDRFLADWKAHFQVDQLVRGRVVAVDAERGRVQMSLKASVVDDAAYVPPATLADFRAGQVVRGRVRKVEEFGAFVVLDHSANVSGLCHRSEMADAAVRDARTLYKEGDVVKAKILSINAANGRVNLGLKPAYFEGGASEGDGSDEDAMSVDADDDGAALDSDEDEDSGEDVDEDADSDAEMADGLHITGTDNDLAAADEESSDEEEEGGVSAGGLSAGGFDWSGGDLADGDSDDDDDAGAGADRAEVKTKTKKRKAAADVDRTAELDVRGPQTAGDFERLLLGQPDASALWTAYMAFQLQVSELGKARAVAERAIRTINVREETERLNVWLAYLNLEVVYGSEETAAAVFQRACQYNDAQEVFERTASIYIQSGQLEKADALFQTMTKRFGAQAPQVWVNYAHFLHHGLQDAERARGLLPRALQMLPAHAHVGLMARVAALEFRSPVGSQERGRTVFEGLLAKTPKKWDLWDQLLDLETAVYAAEKAKEAAAGKAGKAGKAGSRADASVVRDVFARGTRVPGLKARRAKTWFQRWAKWEEEHGDAKSREQVSERAQAWAAAAAAAAREGR